MSCRELYGRGRTGPVLEASVNRPYVFVVAGPGLAGWHEHLQAGSLLRRRFGNEEKRKNVGEDVCKRDDQEGHPDRCADYRQARVSSRWRRGLPREQVSCGHRPLTLELLTGICEKIVAAPLPEKLSHRTPAPRTPGSRHPRRALRGRRRSRRRRPPAPRSARPHWRSSRGFR